MMSTTTCFASSLTSRQSVRGSLWSSLECSLDLIWWDQNRLYRCEVSLVVQPGIAAWTCFERQDHSDLDIRDTTKPSVQPCLVRQYTRLQDYRRPIAFTVSASSQTFVASSHVSAVQVHGLHVYMPDPALLASEASETSFSSVDHNSCSVNLIQRRSVVADWAGAGSSQLNLSKSKIVKSSRYDEDSRLLWLFRRLKDIDRREVRVAIETDGARMLH